MNINTDANNDIKQKKRNLLTLVTDEFNLLEDEFSNMMKDYKEGKVSKEEMEAAEGMLLGISDKLKHFRS